MNVIEQRKKMRLQVINNAVTNIRGYGYKEADEQNIFDHPIHSALFTSMIRENFGKDKKLDQVLTNLLDEIEKPKPLRPNTIALAVAKANRRQA